MKTIKQAVPVLPVADMAATVSFWRRLGFVASLFPDGAEADFAILERDGVEVMLQRFSGYRKQAKTRPGGSWDVYLRVSRIRDLTSEGQPQTRAYGGTELELADPNGHVIVLSQEPTPEA